jgi:hypothetical protein
LTKLGDSASLDLRVVEVQGEKPSASVFIQAKKMEEIIARVDELARKVDEKILGYSLSPPVAEKPAGTSKETAAIPTRVPGFQPMRPAKPERSAISSELWQSQPFSFAMKGLAIGDADGDGRLEGGRFDSYLAVDIADIQKNGRGDIFVTSLRGDKLSSFVVAFREGDYRIVSKDLDWFLRVVDWGEKGKVLLGQRKGNQEGWVDSVYELGWDGKGYKEIRKAEIPQGPTVYGFTPFAYGGKMFYVFVDSDFTLKAMDQKGKVIWRSRGTYGSDNSFRVKSLPSGVGYYEGDEFAFVNVRVIPRGNEILIIRHMSPVGQFFKRQKYYSGSEIQRLVWNGAMFMESWRSSEIPGYAADFQMQDIDGQGGKELVLAVNLPRESILSGEKNSALMVSRIQ